MLICRDDSLPCHHDRIFHWVRPCLQAQAGDSASQRRARAGRAGSEAKQDYLFASLMDPSPTPVSVEVLLSDRLQLHLYQVPARRPARRL